MRWWTFAVGVPILRFEMHAERVCCFGGNWRNLIYEIKYNWFDINSMSLYIYISHDSYVIFDWFDIGMLGSGYLSRFAFKSQEKINKYRQTETVWAFQLSIYPTPYAYTDCPVLTSHFWILIPVACHSIQPSQRPGSATHSMGVYFRGFGAAFSTSMKLWHIGKWAFVPSQAGPDRVVVLGDEWCGMRFFRLNAMID